MNTSRARVAVTIAVVVTTIMALTSGSGAMDPGPDGGTSTTTTPTTTAPTTTAPSSPPSPTPYIVGGTQSAPGAGPWTVAILNAGTADRYQAQFCGGSLIAPSWVLTAAHCTLPPAPATIDVLTGTQSLGGSGGQRIRVIKKIPHPQYDPYTEDNDVALLQLADPSTSPTIQPLAPGFEGAWSPGTAATVYGWGNTSMVSGGASYPTALRQVTIPVISDNACSSPSVYGSEFHASTMLCAGYLGSGGKDSCDGDSGGPLVVPFGYGYAQIGVVNWGIPPCGQAAYPGVYARVPTYTNWITQGSRYGPFDMLGFIQHQYLDFNNTFANQQNQNFWSYVFNTGTSPGSLIVSLNSSNAWDYTAGSTTRLYRAVFGRDPDTAGLKYWVQSLRAGHSLGWVAGYFTSSPEFISKYGSLNNDQFIDLVYQNVLNRAPDSGGRAYWLDRMAKGLNRGGVMISFSDSKEFRDNTDAKVSRLTLWFGVMQRVPTQAEQSTLAGQSLQAIADSIPNNIEYNRRF